MKKEELISYLDKFLSINEYIDSSKNGLQVDNEKIEIKKIGYAVDATTYVFDKAIKENIDLLIVHHGIYWGYEETLTGILFQRIKKLVKNDIALYAAHIPLDAHEEVGNNIGIVKAFTNIFGIRDYEINQFGEYKGKYIGYGIKFENKIHIANILIPFCETMKFEKKLFNFGKKEYINSLAVISGGAGGDFMHAKKENYDIYITGEAKHENLISAKENGQTILLGGHRETEKIGVKLLANHLNKTFGIETIFLDEKY